MSRLVWLMDSRCARAVRRGSGEERPHLDFDASPRRQIPHGDRAAAVKRLTGARTLKAALEAAGARYTGTQTERDGKLVTGLDDAAGFRFGKALVQVVRI